MKSITVNRLPLVLRPSHNRVLIRPFVPESPHRISHIIARVMSLSEEEVRGLLAGVLQKFRTRHPQIQSILLKHFESVRRWMFTDEKISRERQLLVGSYFTQEYSLESAALFNPSIVPHPDQDATAEGGLRFLLSLRATGEGHISSIVFRMGEIGSDGRISLVEPTPYVTQPDRIVSASYNKAMFMRKLHELGLENRYSLEVLGTLHESFTMEELLQQIEMGRRRFSRDNDARTTFEGVRNLAYSNYEVRFRPDQKPSERAVFPSSPSERNGIEDARFVRFREDDGSWIYYATYTAFDGEVIFPQLLETADFLHFKFITLNGPAVKNKGMALFPRKIRGLYAMLSRQDNENIYLMYSDNIHFWYSPRILVRPTYTWEFVQLGNCGSPIETDQGWLVLSHGVGPMRRYCMGAFLLDRNDPSRVIGRLPKPLLEPNENEREGYVPNVVYTCGALVHDGTLFVPYAMSDYASTFATVAVDEVIDAME